MYSQFRCLSLEQCLPLPSDVSAEEGAASFVNPLTALAMVETMRRESHTALVHTAAASNLGQMLNRVCIEEGIDLVNIVRRAEQVALLKSQGAKYICDSSSPDFDRQLADALKNTGATIAFDATGGGSLASQILSAMEKVLNGTQAAYSRYGSAIHKQVYLYGGLQAGPTSLARNYGMAWGLGGWLLTPTLAKIGSVGVARMKDRVAAGLRSTFASHFERTLSLASALQPASIEAYIKAATGKKFLLNPQL
jgi:NADPH2:quinone reductase